MRDRSLDDPTIPPPGQRTGMGSGSIVPFLAKSLAAKPRAHSDFEWDDGEAADRPLLPDIWIGEDAPSK
jgi:hypothetical protein